MPEETVSNMSEEAGSNEKTQPQQPEAAPEENPGKSSKGGDKAAKAENDTIAALLKQVEEVTKERDDLRDQLLRAMADHQNFRRRIMQDREQDKILATQGLVQDLLPVLDNFERTLAAIAAGASSESVTEGVLSIDRQLRTILESRQLTRIKAKGQPFDPNLHEAIGVEESAEHPDNTVLQELEAGYAMGERVIRPARVRVTKRP